MSECHVNVVLICNFKVKTKTYRSHTLKVFSMCSCLTLKLKLHQSAWYELHVAFFMLANWIILTGFEVKENILINQLISCISSFSVSRQSFRILCIILTKIGYVLLWWAQILILWETSCFDMSICAFGPRLVNMMPTDSPNWACFRFIIHKLGICHLWSAITLHAEEVDFLNSLFHYSTPIYVGVCRQVKLNR